MKGWGVAKLFVFVTAEYPFYHYSSRIATPTFPLYSLFIFTPYFKN